MAAALLPVLVPLYPTGHQWISECLLYGKERIFTNFSEELFGEGQVIGIAYVSRVALFTRFPKLPFIYNNFALPFLDALCHLSENRAHSFTHGSLLLFVEFNNKLYYVFTEMTTRSRLLFCASEPFPVTFNVLMGLPKSKPLSAVLELARNTPLYDVYSNNCKHYCKNIVNTLRGEVPAELIAAFATF